LVAGFGLVERGLGFGLVDGEFPIDFVALTRMTRPVESVVIDTFMPGLSFDIEELRPASVTRVELEIRNIRVLLAVRSFNTILSAVTDSIVPPYTPARTSAADDRRASVIDTHSNFAKPRISHLCR
jgi:hypothetical protein